MIVRALSFHLGDVLCGLLCQYEVTDTDWVTTFVADPDFVLLQKTPLAPMLSLALKTAQPEQVEAFFANRGSPQLSGAYSNRNSWLLPPFWQNLLPEGVFRDHVAQLRGCAPTDHMEMLAACGSGLPGNVSIRPHDLSDHDLARVVTQGNDALETSVFQAPMARAESLSGVQPKVAVLRDGQRFVARTSDKSRDTTIIAKLPVVGQARLPELEALSLQLAHAAGVDTCHAYLAALRQLEVEHGYDLGDVDGETQFLAVERFDRVQRSGSTLAGTPRGRSARIHWEDFAQVLSIMPENKYMGSYAAVALVMMSQPSLGLDAVHELLRRLAVSEMLGNTDMHLKNMGLIYRDGRTPTLAPAFDVVGYAAYGPKSGHALDLLLPEPDGLPAKPKRKGGGAGPVGAAKPPLTPKVLRSFCAQVGIQEKPAGAVIRHCAAEAFKAWPAMIEASALTQQQKTRLLAHFNGHPWIEQLRSRAARAADKARIEA